MKGVNSIKSKHWAMRLHISQNQDSDDSQGDRQREMGGVAACAV